jgi:hypothetical protein
MISNIHIQIEKPQKTCQYYCWSKNSNQTEHIHVSLEFEPHLRTMNVPSSSLHKQLSWIKSPLCSTNILSWIKSLHTQREKYTSRERSLTCALVKIEQKHVFLIVFTHVKIVNQIINSHLGNLIQTLDMNST